MSENKKLMICAVIITVIICWFVLKPRIDLLDVFRGYSDRDCIRIRGQI